MHIFQYYDIITKNRSLLAYDGHSALLKSLITICVLECMCMCVGKRMRD